MANYVVHLTSNASEMKVFPDGSDTPLPKLLQNRFVLFGALRNSGLPIILKIKLKRDKKEITAKCNSTDITDYIYPDDEDAFKFLFLPAGIKSAIYSTIIVPLANLEYLKFETSGTTKMLLLSKDEVDKVEKIEKIEKVI